MARIGTFQFTAPLWLHSGDAGWYFVTVPADVSDDIAELTAGLRKGFGSVRVRVTVGATSWQTSVFPDSKRGAFVLPVKRVVRIAEGLSAGAEVKTQLELVDF
ncbi:Domain of unknown function DUF1905 [Kribbella flavida DSM 17836]|uniref:DUF1905 domain-containing protein n=1 Tax=Kribbella flavida (strain DSM 17836 / JCM 10339 / NBRC 14399) TaxID=479435 RepID=D2PP63_KRIFD|nr:DUF1905 domain-containing protein [Kribbella flavida]ADB34659.1 Domain of unknown function DUF1905 [Kribbella flavida DSM 17836]